MSTDFFNIAGIFKTNTELFKKTIQGIPPERWFASPGNDSNHLMWIAGHVVVHRGMVLRILGQEWSAPWQSLFVRGGSPVATEQYPAVEEIVRSWDEVSTQLASSLEGAPDEMLAQPSSKGITLDGKVSGKIAFLSLHECYHVGQMAYLRKWLGHGQTVG
jgi:hypothetical protein